MITISMIIIWVAYILLMYLAIFWILEFVESGVEDDTKIIDKFPFVSIAIPAYNEEKNIEETVNSVLNLDYPKDRFEIIVVNDGSTDKTKQLVNSIIKGNKLFNITLYNQKNSGKASALNRALSVARGEFFVTLDADSYAKSDALKKIIPHFSDDSVAVVMPLMKVRDPKKFLEKLQWAEYLINLFYKKLMSKLDCVHVAPGPFSVYRKNVLEEAGKFDEKNITEDLEMSLKIQKRHYKLLQIFSTEVYTKVPPTLKKFIKQRNRWYKGTYINLFRHRMMLFNKNYGDFGMIQIPRLFLEGFVVLVVFFVLLFSNILDPLIRQLYNLYLTSFNIKLPIEEAIATFSLFDLSYSNMFYGFTTLLLAITLMLLAYRTTREKIKKSQLLSIAFYFTAYIFLTSIILITVVFDLIRGKTHQW